MTPTEVKDALTILGGALGAFAFFWRLWDTFVSHVKIDLQTSVLAQSASTGQSGPVVATITIENQGMTPKRVSYAALLIGPPAASADTLAKRLCEAIAPGDTASQHPLHQLYKLTYDKPLQTEDKSVALVPLPFFYLHQAQIGNEKVQFKCALDKWLAPGEQHRIYLIAVSKEPLGLVRWRLTSDLVVAPVQRPRPIMRIRPKKGT